MLCLLLKNDVRPLKGILQIKSKKFTMVNWKITKIYVFITQAPIHRKEHSKVLKVLEETSGAGRIWAM